MFLVSVRETSVKFLRKLKVHGAVTQFQLCIWDDTVQLSADDRRQEARNEFRENRMQVAASQNEDHNETCGRRINIVENIYTSQKSCRSLCCERGETNEILRIVIT